MEQDLYRFAKQLSIPLEVSLAPQSLDCNYRENIRTALIERYEGNCIAGLGYIIKIINAGRIISDTIGSMTPNALLAVDVDLMSFLPQEGMCMKVNIDIIFTHGIFAYRDKIRILIPISSLKEWTLHKDFTAHKLINKTTGIILRKGNTISIELQEVRFEKDGYSCIGDLVA